MKFDCDVENLYGKIFAPFLKAEPDSARFLADGSPVTVFKGTRLAVSEGAVVKGQKSGLRR